MSDTPNLWQWVGGLHRGELVYHAQRRAIVRLDTGETARLLNWDSRHQRGRCRVEFRPGSARTIPGNRVQWVWCDENPQVSNPEKESPGNP